MQIIAILKTFIYLVASSLFLPVLFILSILFLWMLMYSGTFFKSWLMRQKIKRANRKQAIDLVGRIRSRNFEDCLPGSVSARIKILESLGKKGDSVAVINLLRDTEHQMWRSLDTLKLVIRVGPGLGLIGTLIPMGTGLAALGQGDLGQLSQDLVIAFTTTVVGMASGLVAYVFFTVQRRWVEQDLKTIELAAEILCTQEKPDQTVKAA